MEKLSKEQVETIDVGGTYGRTLFLREISGLAKGEAIKILRSEWTKKSPPSSYYKSAPSTKGIVDVKNYGDFFLIVKR